LGVNRSENKYIKIIKKFSEELKKYDKNQNLVNRDLRVTSAFSVIPAKAGIQDGNQENRKENHKIFFQEVEDSVKFISLNFKTIRLIQIKIKNLKHNLTKIKKIFHILQKSKN